MDSNENGLLLELLEHMTHWSLEPNAEMGQCVLADNETTVSRGLPRANNENKQRLQNELLAKKRREKITQNMEHLKNLIKQRNEDASLKCLAKMINEITTPRQKRLFIKELGNVENYDNVEYIPWNNNSEHCISDSIEIEGRLYSRSGVPQMPNDIFESINLYSINDANDMDLSPRINSDSHSADNYLIRKGIHYCRILLTKSYHAKDSSIIKELKSRNILNIVLNEIILEEKNYIMNLADNYPASYNEILFIMREERDAILKSSIFVNLAQQNISSLYEFLFKLVNDGVTKNELSKYCDESDFYGRKVSHFLVPNPQKGDAETKTKIERFLSRHKKSPPRISESRNS